ncbi:glycosyltransferase family 4 protein [Paenibacillus sp. B2(2019)]|uniref:glycosyltransferase family 4 protein n=1 Tax=Paenibacillus sp. B2(2019) TaxID=2607754 RepID=UPI0011F3113C|nr:glycosyltransferase family 4 protein [Paenibacillus sp. B2(2019)]KAA1190771.1 glycosyltransferase family 4 protein [Paenibacillus sp. B2(2019)]
MMRILYFYKFCILGGVTTQLANRLKFLRHHSEVHFAFLEDYGGASAFDGYEHVRILGTVEEIKSYMEVYDFDVIITIDTYELYEALGPVQEGKVIIHEVHTTYSEPLQKLAATKDSLPFHYVITPSAYMKDYLDGIGIAGAYHINNCLDTDLFRYEAGIEQEPATILWVGKLDDHKNWSSYLNIAGKLNAKMPELQFMLVGGYTAPDEIKKQLMVKVEQQGIKHFKWIPKVDYDEMHRYYSSVAQNGGLYISTTTNESFGMTVLEAMACRCPVVVPSVGALLELLDGPLSVSLYESGNEEECVDRLSALLEQNSLREGLKSLGEQKARTAYSIEQVGKEYMELLERFREERLILK